MTTTDADPFGKFKAAQREAWSSFLPVEVITTIPAAKLVKFAQVAPEQKLLDVACGTGVVAVTAARRGAKVSGLDLSPVLLERARHNAGLAAVDIDFTEGDAEALPYPDASFDVVLRPVRAHLRPASGCRPARDVAGSQGRRSTRILDLAARAFYRAHVHVSRGLFAAATSGNRAAGARGFVGRPEYRSRTARRLGDRPDIRPRYTDGAGAEPCALPRGARKDNRPAGESRCRTGKRRSG